MAIPATPTQVVVIQGNGEVSISSALSAGATSYSVQRSTDAITYSVIATPTAPSYLDTTVTLGVQYYYQMASVNASGTSSYSPPIPIIPTPTAEMSLQGLRLASQQKADRVGSNFVSQSEWATFINQAMFELYDLLVTAYEDYYVAAPLSITTDGTNYLYALPNGTNHSGAEPFYKLMGVDLAINTTANGYVTINKFNFIDRNRFIYPNTASTIYGVFNLRYRLVGSQIEFIPTPSASQQIRLWYVPRLPQLLQDTDITTIGVSGWLQYVIVRAAKYALDKEESDTSKLDAELIFLKDRIEASSVNRDIGQPDTISDVRQGGVGGSSSGYGWNSGMGGW